MTSADVEVGTDISTLSHSPKSRLLQRSVRLPSNLRTTTRKCVHLVTRGHFRSRDIDGSRHTIRSAIVENHMLHAKLYGSMFYRTGVFALREYVFSTFITFVTLTLTR